MVLRGVYFRAAGIILAILLFAYIALLLTVNSSPFEQWLKAELAQRTGYQVAGELHLDPLLRLNLSAVTASKASKLVLQAEHITLVITPLAVFSKRIRRLRLEKPALYLELNELMKGTKEAGSDISIQNLNIEDGALVLTLGSGNSLEFKSLAMNAQNVNLGQATGLNLRADVPWLNGVAQVVLKGDGNGKLARLRVEQAPDRASGNFLKPRPPAADALEAEIKLSEKEGKSLALAATGKLTGMLIGEKKISGHFDARADLGANREQAEIAAKIVATELPAQVRFSPITLPRGTSSLVLEGSFSMPDKKLALRSFDLRSPLGEASGAAQMAFAPEISFADSKVGLRRVPFEQLKSLLPAPLDALVSGGLLDADLVLRGAMRALQVQGSVQVAGVKLGSEQFSLEDLTLKTPVALADGSFQAADVRITGKKLRARQKSDMPVSAEELRIQGTWEQKADGPVKGAAQLRISQGRFTSLDGTRVGENLTLAGRVEAISARDRKQTSLAGKLDIEQGEMLWRKFFGDLKSQRPSLQFDGDYVPGEDALRLRRLNFTLATVGTLVARGDILQTSNNPALRLEIKSDDIQPSGFYEFFVRPTFNRSFPLLDQLSVGGRLGFAVTAKGTLDSLSLEGDLQLRRGEIQNKSKKWHVGPVQLALPFRIEYPGTSLPPSPANLPSGTLTIESARLGAEVIPAIRTTLSFWNNALAFREPIRLPIYGGALEISDLAFRNVIEDPQALSLSLEAKDLQLQRVTQALGWYRFDGRISGSIPKIEWGSGSLRSQGKIQGEVFGGRVQISNLEVDSPFSSVPSIKLDALFRDISLDQASATFAFGQISGVLEGTVNQLVMTAGQPSEFRADVYSVEKRGVSQRISVESLNKITVLSSGTDAGVLYGGIASFFDTFRYSKLGFKAALKNDKLTLRGVESRKDGEYLVVGSLIPPTVNVVSHTQVIAFSELLRRLEQVQQSGKAEKLAK
jgi:hypothetical protein